MLEPALIFLTMIAGDLEFLTRLHVHDGSQVVCILAGDLRVSALDCFDEKAASRHEHYCTRRVAHELPTRTPVPPPTQQVLRDFRVLNSGFYGFKI